MDTILQEDFLWGRSGDNRSGDLLSQRRYFCGKLRMQAHFPPNPCPILFTLPLPPSSLQLFYSPPWLTLECGKKSPTETRYRMINSSRYPSQRLRIWPVIFSMHRAIAKRGMWMGSSMIRGTSLRLLWRIRIVARDHIWGHLFYHLMCRDRKPTVSPIEPALDSWWQFLFSSFSFLSFFPFFRWGIVAYNLRPRPDCTMACIVYLY